MLKGLKGTREYLLSVCIGLASPVSVTASVDTSNVPKE